MCTQLYDREIDEQLIMERSGHSNVDAVRSYKRTTAKLQRSVSQQLEPFPVCVSNEKKSAKESPNETISHQYQPASVTGTNIGKENTWSESATVTVYISDCNAYG